MGRVIDALIAYRLLKLLVTPFKKTKAYKLGIVDEKGKEIENGDGISHQKDGGLKIEFNWEKQENNQYKVFASLK